MKHTFNPFSLERTKLNSNIFKERAELNYKYVMSLKSEYLLQNHYMEAGLWGPPNKPGECHWGWESPTSQVRGHFLGHWLSAASKIYATTKDIEVKAKADKIVSELARCQEENGGEWAGSIPEKYLSWLPKGKSTWAPQYVLHKTLMGLYDMYKFAGNEQAIEVMSNWAKWYQRWTAGFSREQMDDILDYETGGMLEVWADLYGVTGKPEHLELISRYDRPRLFNRLLAGDDVISNMHANTTIPEILGAARAWEVTGEQRWRDIVEAYWKYTVTERGYYCTGGQTCSEIWSKPYQLSNRLGDKNQEHCTVYNMMRLAEFLLKWTGDVQYADYIERNLYNGILAQQNLQTGMITYYLPLQAGGKKKWGTPTDDFWCCHGTLIQAHSAHNGYIYYEDGNDIVLCQYIPSELTLERPGNLVKINQTFDQYDFQGLKNINNNEPERNRSITFNLNISCEQPVEFGLKLRIPWWIKGNPVISVNGVPEVVECTPSSYYTVRRIWNNDTIRVILPKGLTCCPLPDMPDTVAFMDGPAVLAGICDEERILHGDKSNPETMLIPDNEREWEFWKTGYRTHNQQKGLRFIPLYEVCDERYTIYFQVQ